MKKENEILINKYGQGIVGNETLLTKFSLFNIDEKRSFLNDFLFLIMQSKPKIEDAEYAILESGLNPRFAPCVLLKKGVATHQLKKIIELPEAELKHAFILLLSLFKISYKRRFELEKNNPNKWWYWDLSDETKVKQIMITEPDN